VRCRRTPLATATSRPKNAGRHSRTRNQRQLRPHAVAGAWSRDRGRRCSSVDEISIALRSRTIGRNTFPLRLRRSCSPQVGMFERGSVALGLLAHRRHSPHASKTWQSRTIFPNGLLKLWGNGRRAVRRAAWRPLAIAARYDRRDGRRRINITGSSSGKRDRHGQGPSRLPKEVSRVPPQKTAVGESATIWPRCREELVGAQCVSHLMEWPARRREPPSSAFSAYVRSRTDHGLAICDRFTIGSGSQW
jgi:hypothetical protein